MSIPYSEALQELEKKQLRRTLNRIESPQGARILLGGKTLVNFASNDYLGLAYDERLIRAAGRALESWGTGSGASRLLSGSLGIHHALEERIAAFKREEAALVFSSGFQTNLGVICALAGPGDWVFVDRFSHASLIDAVRLSGARLRVYPHCDVNCLDELLAHAKTGRRWVLTDTYFSMDGDLAPLGELALVSRRRGAGLVVDEAHATGIFGPTGRGLTEACGVEGRVTAIVGTFSKAMGSQGGFALGEKKLIDYLVSKARAFIYTTAPAPAASGASLEAIRLLEEDPSLRESLWSKVMFLRGELAKRGFDLMNSEGPIIPVRIGETSKAVGFSRALFDQGIWAPAVRPPTVPRGTDRIRLSVSAKHAESDLERLIEAIGKAREKVG